MDMEFVDNRLNTFRGKSSSWNWKRKRIFTALVAKAGWYLKEEDKTAETTCFGCGEKKKFHTCELEDPLIDHLDSCTLGNALKTRIDFRFSNEIIDDPASFVNDIVLKRLFTFKDHSIQYIKLSICGLINLPISDSVHSVTCADCEYTIDSTELINVEEILDYHFSSSRKCSYIKLKPFILENLSIIEDLLRKNKTTVEVNAVEKCDSTETVENEIVDDKSEVFSSAQESNESVDLSEQYDQKEDSESVRLEESVILEKDEQLDTHNEVETVNIINEVKNEEPNDVQPMKFNLNPIFSQYSCNDSEYTPMELATQEVGIENILTQRWNGIDENLSQIKSQNYVNPIPKESTQVKLLSTQNNKTVNDVLNNLVDDIIEQFYTERNLAWERSIDNNLDTIKDRILKTRN